MSEIILSQPPVTVTTVANSPLALRSMCDLPRTGCARRTTTICIRGANNNNVIMVCELNCCLLPQCEALRTCRSSFPIATKLCCDQDVKDVPGSAFTQRTCDRCGLLWWRSELDQLH